MAKKEKKEEIVFSPDNDLNVVEEEKPMFETEAYGSPHPEAGSDVTVMKTVGIGGPVPIVAPKHNTIQLQPIVVPLAVVPYMTQDSNVLRTDGKQQEGYAEDDFGEAAKFENVVEKKKIINKQARFSRIFALITLIVSLLIEVPFIISKFGISLFNENLNYLNIIEAISTWIAGGTVSNTLEIALYMATFACTGLIALVALICIFVGKYPRGFFGILSFVSFGVLIAIMILQIVAGSFNANGTKVLITLIAVTALNFVLSVIFSVILNKVEDRKESKAIKEI